MNADDTALPRALVIGSPAAPYHPLAGVEAAFRATLGADFALAFTENREALLQAPAPPRLVVAYADTWNEPVPESIAGALLEFVRRGGGLLAVHNGICWAGTPALRPLFGAVFTGHPDSAAMRYAPVGGHPITAGLAAFELHEEPYRYDVGKGLDAELILQYAHEGREWPAGWARQYGAGRFAHLQPGHRAEAFASPGYAELARRAARWCAGLSIVA